MDVVKPANPCRKRFRLAAYSTVALVGVSTMFGLSRLKPAAPAVERATLMIDTVKRGPLLRDVRGAGTLVPEEIRWISATTQGRVERIAVQPGTPVRPDTVILELSNPQLDQELREAQLRVSAAEAALQYLRVELRNEYLHQKATAAQITADFTKAKMQAQMNESLAAAHLVSELQRQQSKIDAAQLAIREELAREELAGVADSTKARLSVQEAELAQARAVIRLKVQQHDELKVRAGLEGILQIVSAQVGQQVAPGTNLARVANPNRLKAQIRIGETQAKDIQIGQRAQIDTRSGIVRGVVARIDPSVQNGTITVDVALASALPKGAVPDLSINGTIELERLSDVLSVGRPALGQDEGTVRLFRVQSDGTAVRVPVRLGRGSAASVEILSGLRAGDQVVLSDMSAWDSVDRIHLQ